MLYTYASLTLTLLILWFILRIRKYRSIDHFPGPSFWELIKLTCFSNGNIDTYNFVINLNDRFGPVVKIWMKPFKPTLMVSNKSFVEAILNSSEFVHKTETYRLFRPLLGNGLFNVPDDNEWKTDRKALGYAFNAKSMEKYAMQYKSHAIKFINDLKEYENTCFNVEPLCSEYAINIILDLLVSEHLKAKNESKSELVRCVDVFRRTYLERAYSLYKKYDWVFKHTNSYKEMEVACKYVRNLLEDIMQRHMEIRSKATDDKEDFLTLLINCNLPYERTLDHLITFILAAMDTTSRAISFCLYELAKYPNIQQKITDEYNSVIANNETISFADIQNMHYTEAVVKEVLRIYPGIPIIQRQLLKSVVVDGVIIPEGTDINFNIMEMQKSEEYFKNPTEFDPDRFLYNENERNTLRNAYIPFSSGPRDCIGKKVAMTEIKFIISHTVKHFEIIPAYPEHKLELIARFTLESANGLPVLLKQRI